MKKIKVVLLLIVSIIVILFFVFFPFKREEKLDVKKEKTEEIAFINHGKLWFISDKNSDTLAVINIEIADDEAKREQGLMYRQSLNENDGMLFIFDDINPRFFWMKNTYISLDIIYINENFNIVSIHKTTIPQSEVSLPSEKPAKYVVEVNAGFTYKYKIKKGDRIIFKRY